MSLSPGPARIVRRDDGVAVGVWGPYTLQSAFQPIFSFRKGRLTVEAFEGLLRPFLNGAPVGPLPFFANVPPGERLHIETLARNLHLNNAGAFLDPGCPVFINFDPSLFVERAVADNALRDMRHTLKEAGIEPGRVVCEMTEQKSGSRGALFGFVEALKGAGLGIAVDDYGSDDSDIRRIEELRPDIVKFDGALVKRLMDSGPGFALLCKMAEVFAARGIASVLEGIEETWQIELAETSGANMAQGYALARPEFAPAAFARFRPQAASRRAAVGAGEIAKPAISPTPRSFGRKPG